VAAVRPVTLARVAARVWWLPLVPIGVLADRGSRRRWLLTPGVVIVTALVASLGKLAIRRPRPSSSYRVAPWGHLGAAGFPSTHSACAFAVAGWLRASRQRRWLHSIAVVVSLSRVRCRAHHFTDVAAGAVLGYLVAWQAERVVGAQRSRRANANAASAITAVDHATAHGQIVALTPLAPPNGPSCTITPVAPPMSEVSA
jgi:hypothetical protein